VNARISKRRISTKQQNDITVPAAADDSLEPRFPVLRALDIPFPEHGSFYVADLVEAEQEKVARASKMAVVHRALLPAVSLIHRAVYIEHNPRELPRSPDAVDPLPRKLAKSRLVLLRSERSRLEPTDLTRR